MQTRSIVFTIIVATTIGATSYGIRSTLAASDHDAHSAHETTTGSAPQEPGQSAFAAIAEIVSILRSDPDTNWEKVNMTALRNHLVDMEMLTTEANYTATEFEGRIEFEVFGSKRAVEAARRMVPAHVQELSKASAWQIWAEETNRGVKMTVQPTDSITVTRIKALGFFGIMATGAHHQPHHLAIANGKIGH